MVNAQELAGHWDQLRGKVKEKWGQLTDDDLRMVGGNIDQLIGRIEQKTGEKRGAIETFLNGLLSGDAASALHRARDTVSQYTQEVGQRAREGYEQVSDRAREGYERAGEMVDQYPASSMGVVFGVGLLAGVMVGLLLHSD